MQSFEENFRLRTTFKLQISNVLLNTSKTRKVNQTQITAVPVWPGSAQASALDVWRKSQA